MRTSEEPVSCLDTMKIEYEELLGTCATCFDICATLPPIFSRLAAGSESFFRLLCGHCDAVACPISTAQLTSVLFERLLASTEPW